MPASSASGSRSRRHPSKTCVPRSASRVRIARWIETMQSKRSGGSDINPTWIGGPGTWGPKPTWGCVAWGKPPLDFDVFIIGRFFGLQSVDELNDAGARRHQEPSGTGGHGFQGLDLDMFQVQPLGELLGNDAALNGQELSGAMVPVTNDFPID